MKKLILSLIPLLLLLITPVKASASLINYAGTGYYGVNNQNYSYGMLPQQMNFNFAYMFDNVPTYLSGGVGYINLKAIPEPSTLLLIGSGLAILAVMMRRNKPTNKK